MIKYGISHAALALITILSGEVISRKILQYWPAIEHDLAVKLQPFLAQHNWYFDTYHLGILITIALFGFFWGAIFKSISD